MNPHSKALDSMIGDFDDMETKKMFPEEESKGVSITISVTPNGEITAPEGEGIGLNKGGIVDGYSKGGTVPKPELEADIHSGYDKGKDPLYEKGEMGMAKGGIVNPNEDSEDLALPLFLRRKKKGISA